MPKGLTADIFKSTTRDGVPQDHSNGGISSRCREVTVMDLPGGEVFDVTPERPAVRLVQRIIYGKPYVHAEPIDQPKGVLGPMFGGCYIATCDSRFRQEATRLGCPGAVPLHDRFESRELYQALSE